MAKEEENMMVKPAMVRVGVISPVTEPEAWPVLLWCGKNRFLMTRIGTRSCK